jgi:hypothetical protein
MKVGLDLALGVGKKLNENKTMDHTALKKKDAEAANKVFTISKCVRRAALVRERAARAQPHGTGCS